MGTHKYVFQKLTIGQSEKERLLSNACEWEELKLEHESGANVYLDASVGCRMSAISMDCPVGP